MATLTGDITATTKLIPTDAGIGYYQVGSELIHLVAAVPPAIPFSDPPTGLMVAAGTPTERRPVGGSTAASHSSGSTLTQYYPEAPGGEGSGGSMHVTDGVTTVDPTTELRFPPGLITDDGLGVAVVQTFTWVQDTDPTSAPTNATPEDGQTWLDTLLVAADGYYRLWVWFDANSGWCNYEPSFILRNSVFGSGTRLYIGNNGSLNVVGLPTADPAVAGQIYTDGVPSAGVPKALMVSGG